MRVLSLAALIVKWLVYKDNRGRVVIGLFQADFADSVKLANLELKGRKEGRKGKNTVVNARCSVSACLYNATAAFSFLPHPRTLAKEFG